MQRYAVGVQYDGHGYHGWQRQLGGISTVQEALEHALSKVADHPVTVTCAGRTDTGVHGLGQVIHFDSPADRSLRGYRLGANVFLPPDISVQWIKAVPNDFHARFSALSRRYLYFIANTSSRQALFHRQLTWHLKPLSLDKMNEAAAMLCGEHDFSAFRGSGCQAKSPVRTVEWCRLSQAGQVICLDVKANAFLLHMVRNFAGTLLKIGSGDAEPSWMREVIASVDRRQGGMTAPPNGLYFYQVDYPEHFAIPKTTADPLQLLYSNELV